ncbi:hypothetical protein B0H17DRAFT_1137081 [Mycena rosella]|uniref:Uncharacterized protein n=1 Tax=Mycena rosella TaxID=1033263 RepID=A0AAD7D9H5_MYCRO|nr:hypothetical protein B0H17DRAFT_1137081 [Mycena rosella]
MTPNYRGHYFLPPLSSEQTHYLGLKAQIVCENVNGGGWRVMEAAEAAEVEEISIPGHSGFKYCTSLLYLPLNQAYQIVGAYFMEPQAVDGGWWRRRRRRRWRRSPPQVILALNIVLHYYIFLSTEHTKQLVHISWNHRRWMEGDGGG